MATAANPPANPSNKRVLAVIIVSAVVGLAVGVGVATYKKLEGIGGNGSTNQTARGPIRTAPEILSNVKQLSPDTCVQPSKYRGLGSSQVFTVSPTYDAARNTWFAGCPTARDTNNHLTCVYVNDQTLETRVSSNWERCEHGF